MLFDMYSDSIRSSKRSQKIEPKTMENYTKFIQFFDTIPKIETIVKRDLNKDKNLKALLGEMKVFVEDCMNKVFQIIIIYFLKYF